MWSFAVLLTALFACSSPEPVQKPAAPAAASAQKANKAKKPGKGAKGVKSAKAGAKGQPGAKAAPGAKGQPGAKTAKTAKTAAPAAKPIGVAGPVIGELKLAAATPAAPAAGAAEAPAAPAAPKTEANLVLGFADGQSSTIGLGTVDGTCAEVTPTPVGPAGKQKTPTWSVKCEDGGKTSEVYVLQLGKAVTVVKAALDPAGAAAPKYKIVKRVPLVDGATLERKPQG